MTPAAAAQMPGELSHKDLSRFQIDILAALRSLGAAKGLRIKDGLQECYGTTVHHGQLYPNLDELDRMGVIAKADGEDERSNRYELTSAGVDVLNKRREWIAGEDDAARGEK